MPSWMDHKILEICEQVNSEEYEQDSLLEKQELFNRTETLNTETQKISPPQYHKKTR